MPARKEQVIPAVYIGTLNGDNLGEGLNFQWSSGACLKKMYLVTIRYNYYSFHHYSSLHCSDFYYTYHFQKNSWTQIPSNMEEMDTTIIMGIANIRRALLEQGWLLNLKRLMEVAAEVKDRTFKGCSVLLLLRGKFQRYSSFA